MIPIKDHKPRREAEFQLMIRACPKEATLTRRWEMNQESFRLHHLHLNNHDQECSDIQSTQEIPRDQGLR